MVAYLAELSAHAIVPSCLSEVQDVLLQRLLVRRPWSCLGFDKCHMKHTGRLPLLVIRHLGCVVVGYKGPLLEILEAIATMHEVAEVAHRPLFGKSGRVCPSLSNEAQVDVGKASEAQCKLLKASPCGARSA